MIGLIDPGSGNLRSVQKACERLGAQARVVARPGDLNGAAAWILPGVGNFEPAARRLAAAGWAEFLAGELTRGKPVLGICLGMQLLFLSSEEGAPAGGPLPRGLGLLPGRVRRFPPGPKVPQIGWNTVRLQRPDPLFAGLPAEVYVYFVHSYYVEPALPDLVVAEAEYGLPYAAAVARPPLWGVQFHPEKSGETGLRLLANFLQLAGAVSRCW